MRLTRFSKLFSGLKIKSEQQLIQELLSESANLEDLFPVEKNRRIDDLSLKVSHILDTQKYSSGALMDAINVATDVIMDAMGPERPMIHAYLRHIQHLAEGSVYDAGMAEKLAERFRRCALNDKSQAQFLTPRRDDGSIALNNWGQYMLQRLKGRLTHDFYDMPESADLKHIRRYL